MKRMSQKFGQTMIVVTHDNKVAEAADRVIQIEDGKIVSDGK
jgi:putative ABC transport system ATP-binding protein